MPPGRRASSAPVRHTLGLPFDYTLPVASAELQDRFLMALSGHIPTTGMDAAAREALCVGVNKVARALERGELAMVVVCADVQPSAIVHHLPVQAYITDVPALVLASASIRVGSILRVRTVAAFGIRKSAVDTPIGRALLAVGPIPPLDIPWLRPLRAGASGAAPPVGLQPLRVILQQPKRNAATAAGAASTGAKRRHTAGTAAAAATAAAPAQTET